MKRRILFVSANYSSFIKQDAEALAKEYDLVRFEFGSRKGISMIVQQASLLFWLAVQVPKSQSIFIWFADYHSLLPTWIGKIFGRRSFLVIGGYDAARLPEYNYGGHNKALRSWFIRRSCRAATTLLHVSSFVKRELERQIGASTPSRSIVVHNGVDTSLFNYKLSWGARDGVICVAFADNSNRGRIKGLDRYIEIASRMPKVNFTLVGVSGEYKQELERTKPNNLKIVGAVQRHELEGLYNQSKVVCLLSRFESFGMSLAEGMLCGCIPVTMSGIGAAEMVDLSCGYVVESEKVNEMELAVNLALESPEKMSSEARKRILDHFTLERRWKSLSAILSAKD